MAIHKKTGNYYKIIGTAIDANNGRENSELQVIYERKGGLFVRGLSEFQQKFSQWEFDLAAIKAAKGE